MKNHYFIILTVCLILSFFIGSVCSRSSVFYDFNNQCGDTTVENPNYSICVASTSADSHQHAFQQCYNSWVGPNFKIKRPFIFFNTSSLPDNCVIHNIYYRYFNEFGTSAGLTCSVQVANAGVSLDDSDFDRTRFSYVLSFFGVNGKGWHNIPFPYNMTFALNKTGISSFVIRFIDDYLGVYTTSCNWYLTNFSSITLNISYYNNPILSNPIPINNSVNSPLNPKLSIDVNEPNNDLMDIYFRTNASGTWATIGSNLTTHNGTYAQQTTGMDIYSHKYYWSINSTNSVLWTNKTYSFITKGYLPILVTSPYPSNNSIDITGTLSTLHVLIRSGNGLPFNYSISLSNGDTYNYSNDDNGTKYLNLSFPLNYNTIYYWWVNVTDGINTTSYYYRFRTEITPCRCIRFDINQLSLVVLGCLMAFFTLLGYLINNAKTGAAFLMFAGIFSILEMISVVAYFGGIWYLSTPGFVVVALIFFKDMLLMIIYGDNWRKGNRK